MIISSKESDKIDEIAALGCQAVRDILSQANSGNEIAELKEMSALQQSCILLELKNIMDIKDSKIQ
jgi:hypothetical protein